MLELGFPQLAFPFVSVVLTWLGWPCPACFGPGSPLNGSIFLWTEKHNGPRLPSQRSFLLSKSPCGSGWDSERFCFQTTSGITQVNHLTGICVLQLDSWDGELNWARCGTCGRSRPDQRGRPGYPLMRSSACPAHSLKVPGRDLREQACMECRLGVLDQL